MKDSAAKGISTARAKDKLANEGQVAARNKAGVGKRNNSSGLSSSSSSISGSTSSTTRSSSSISGTNSRNSTRRMQNQQSINNAIKFAKKIPVLRKKAQMVEKIQKIKNAKSKGFVKSFLPNYSNKKPSDAEIEAANATEQTGEEYKPEDVDSKFTVKLDKKTKILAISIVAGIMLSYIVVGIFDMLSVMDTAKEVYLASHENPTEEEFEAAYNAQAGENDRSSGTYNSNVKSDSTGNIIMVGDSRTVGLCNSVYGISVANCSTLGYKKNNNTFISLTSTAYDWFSSKALPEIKNQLKSNEKSTVFINMGTNRLDDLTNQANSYAKDYNDLAKTYPKANIVAISVTPIIDSKVSYYKNVNLDSNVVKFNNQLKSKISSDVIYCDVYSKVKGKVDASDGVHYDTASYKLINDEILNCIKPSTSTNNNSFESILVKGGISVNTLMEKNIKQLVIVESSSSSANISFYENINNEWNKNTSLNSSGYVGSQGTTDNPSEYKPATPKGLYAIGDAFYQNSKPNTGLNIFKITSNTYWIDDPNSAYYNKRVEGTSKKDWSSAEHMSDISVYKYGFVINYNMNPIKKGAGSAIFFHISSNNPTAGCVSAPEDKVLAYLAKLDRTKNPYILII